MSQELPEMPVPTTPRPFREIPPLWARVGQMNESFFVGELPRTSASNTFFSVAVAAGFTAVLTIASSILGGIKGFAQAPAGGNLAHTAQAVGGVAILFCCLGIILTPISFYLTNTITYVGALIFGGKGKFDSQTYLVSLFFVPLTFFSGLAGLLSVIPTIGIYITAVATLAVALYHLKLTVRTLKVVHGLSTARATGAILLPLLLLIIPVCLIMVLTLMGPMVGKVFSSINLATPIP
jgi:hypothetical protein